MIPRCNWPGGCRTILREGNKTGVCGPHQKALDEERMGRHENLARRKGVDEARYGQQVGHEVIPVKRVVDAAYFFYGVSRERGEQNISFAGEVAIYLLKNDFGMSFERISSSLKCEYGVVQRSFHKVRSLANSSPDLKRNLEQIRNQYRSPA